MTAARRDSCALSMRHGARSSHGRTRYGRFCLLRLDTGVMACSSSNIDGGYSGPEVGATASSTRTSAARFAVHLHTYARPSRRAFMARVGGRRVPGAIVFARLPPTPAGFSLQGSHIHRPIVARTFAVVICACRVDRVGVSDQSTYVCRCLGARTCTSFGRALHGISYLMMYVCLSRRMCVRC